MQGFFRTFWGGLVTLIALMIVLERSGGVSRILGAVGSSTRTVVRSFD
jgi:hypothetical protein